MTPKQRKKVETSIIKKNSNLPLEVWSRHYFISTLFENKCFYRILLFLPLSVVVCLLVSLHSLLQKQSHLVNTLANTKQDNMHLHHCRGELLLKKNLLDLLWRYTLLTKRIMNIIITICSVYHTYPSVDISRMFWIDIN